MERVPNNINVLRYYFGRKELKDKLNALKSQLAFELQPKMDKRLNEERIDELRKEIKNINYDLRKFYESKK